MPESEVKKMYDIDDELMTLDEARAVIAEFEEADELSDTERGEGGFGSTGVNSKKRAFNEVTNENQVVA